MVRTKPYRPSNATEGDIFHGQWCAHCRANAGEDGCDIELRAMANDLDDPDYPAEWVREWQDARNKWGSAICTAYVDVREPERTPRCPSTLDLFGGAVASVSKGK